MPSSLQGGNTWPSIHTTRLHYIRMVVLTVKSQFKKATVLLSGVKGHQEFCFWRMLCNRLNSGCRHLTYVLTFLFPVSPLHMASGQWPPAVISLPSFISCPFSSLPFWCFLVPVFCRKIQSYHHSNHQYY